MYQDNHMLLHTLVSQYNPLVEITRGAGAPCTDAFNPIFLEKAASSIKTALAGYFVVISLLRAAPFPRLSVGRRDKADACDFSWVFHTFNATTTAKASSVEMTSRLRTLLKHPRPLISDDLEREPS